jgi:hypothetical protein
MNTVFFLRNEDVNETQMAGGTYVQHEACLSGVRVRCVATNFGGSIRHGSYIQVNGAVIASDHSKAPDGTANNFDSLGRGAADGALGNEYGIGFYMRRGHTVTILDPATAVSRPGFPMCYDTYSRPEDGSAIADAVRSAAAGDIVVISSFDACGVNHDFRDALTNFCGASTFSNTWESANSPELYREVMRRSHVFVGRRIHSKMSLATSRFKICYTNSVAPQSHPRLFVALEDFITCYCRHYCCDAVSGATCPTGTVSLPRFAFIPLCALQELLFSTVFRWMPCSGRVRSCST